MQIGFIGAGPVAIQLSARFVASGHTVSLGRRTPPTSFADAIARADVVVVAIPFRACATVLPPFADALAGMIVIDATNPLNEDYSPLKIDGGRSAAETIAALLPQSRVVKAFNAIFADAMDRPERGGVRIATFVCGDDSDATNRVGALADGAGYDAIVIPSLAAAAFAEAAAHLNIAIAFQSERGTRSAFGYLP